jgi:hypothetical protein
MRSARFRRPQVAIAAFAIAYACSSRVEARDAHGPGDSLWMPFGLNVGYAVNPAPTSNGLLLGPELSFVYFDRDAFWLGAYTEALHDFGAEEWRLGGGVEGGFANFGVDLGYQGTPNAEAPHALRARLLFSLVFVQLYGGMGVRLEPSDGPLRGELGLLLKFPFELGKLE